MGCLGMAGPFFCGFINGVFFAFPDGDHQHEELVVNDFVDHAIAAGPELDFVMIFKSGKPVCREMGMPEAFVEFLFELSLDGGIELLPFLQCGGKELEFIVHQDLLPRHQPFRFGD